MAVVRRDDRVPPGTVGTTGAANHIAVGSGGCKTCHTSNFVTAASRSRLHRRCRPPVTRPCPARAVTAATRRQRDLERRDGGRAGVQPYSDASAVCSACHASNFVTGGFKIASSPVLSVAGHAAVSSLACGRPATTTLRPT